MKKQISLPIVLTIAFLVAAVAFSLGYVASTVSTNKKIKDLSEKHKMFTKLAAVDNSVRQNYDGKIEEEELADSLCRAYAEAVGDEVLYLTKDEYKESRYYKSKSPNVFELSDNSAIVILSDN